LLRISDPLVVAAVAGSGGTSALIDLRSRRIPNSLTLGITAFGLVLALGYPGGVGIWGALGGFAVGLLLMLPGHLVGATGAGDVKLFAALGTLLGPKGILVAFVYTAIAGGILALVVAARRRRLGATVGRTLTLVRTGGANVGDIEHVASDNRFAYAPAIAAGALAAALGI
jgi:prepilin peptidase CpaA